MEQSYGGFLDDRLKQFNGRTTGTGISLKILISQTASIGDVILSTPLITALKHKYPEAQIWFLTTAAAAGILKPDPRLSGVISFNKKAPLSSLIKKAAEIRQQHFDVVYAVQRSARVSVLLALSGIKKRIGFSSSSLPWLFHQLVPRPKAEHDVLRNLALLQIENFSEDDLKLFVHHEVSEKLSRDLEDPFIAVVPGSLWKTKRWKEENFAELGIKLKNKGLRPIFLGAPDEKNMVDSCAAKSASLSLAGKTSLQEMVYLISKASAVVCNDSSSLHVASAFKVPTVAIFCATSESFGFGPWRNPKAKVLENRTLWCRPCARHGGSFCPTGTELCMSGSGHKDAISAEMVANEVIKALT